MLETIELLRPRLWRVEGLFWEVEVSLNLKLKFFFGVRPVVKSFSRVSPSSSFFGVGIASRSAAGFFLK